MSTPATGKWEEFLLASRATTIYSGTSEVQLNIIAERLLGLPRDPQSGRVLHTKIHADLTLSDRRELVWGRLASSVDRRG
jgi:acyl-CoA dehydrogenase-like protein